MQSRRVSEIGGATLELLTTRGSGMRKAEVVSHFEGRYDKSAIYREVKRLVEAAKLSEVAGIVSIRREA